MKLLTNAAILSAIALSATAYTVEGYAAADCLGTPRTKEERSLGDRSNVEWINGRTQWRSMKIRYNAEENESRKCVDAAKPESADGRRSFQVVFANDDYSHNHIQEWVVPGTDHGDHCFSSWDSAE
jgi:hypothetical protein